MNQKKIDFKERKKMPKKRNLLCCGVKMILADDHGTAMCSVCHKVVDIDE